METQQKEKKAEDDEFEQQRKAIIAEALQAKEEGKSLNFGGQKQVSDFDQTVEIPCCYTNNHNINLFHQTTVRFFLGAQERFSVEFLVWNFLFLIFIHRSPALLTFLSIIKLQSGITCIWK